MTDNPTQLENKLEPCPFCGEAAEVIGDVYEGFTARCASEICQVSPETNNDWHERKRCVGDWNSRAPVVAPQTIYADGYCARCSELAYPLTRALEATGVPTGADNWQQTYGPNKVRALADFESELRRLLLALETGTPEDIKSRIEWAKHSIEFHAAVRRRLTALAQGREPEPDPAPSPSSLIPAEQCLNSLLQPQLRITADDEEPELVKCEVYDCNEHQHCIHYCVEHHKVICTPFTASETDLIIGAIPLQAFPAATPAPVEQEPPRGYWPTLIDRGDGVQGHYCIGQLIKPDQPYWEFWNKDRWCSAGEVFVSRETAQKQLDALRVGEDREPNPLLWVVTRAAGEPCRTYARGCIENQPDQSFWCAPCAARHVIGKADSVGEEGK